MQKYQWIESERKTESEISEWVSDRDRAKLSKCSYKPITVQTRTVSKKGIFVIARKLKSTIWSIAYPAKVQSTSNSTNEIILKIDIAIPSLKKCLYHRYYTETVHLHVINKTKSFPKCAPFYWSSNLKDENKSRAIKPSQPWPIQFVCFSKHNGPLSTLW